MLRTWNEELDSHVQGFMTQASQIKHWDNILLKNSEKVLSLQNDINSLVESQTTLNMDIDKIRGHQNQLVSIIEDLEKNLANINVDNNNNNNKSDDNGINSNIPGLNNRNEVYKMAERIDENLQALNNRLGTKIEELNKEQTIDDNNPLAPVIEILNCHMQSLNWIDRKTQELGETAEQIGTKLQN